MPGMKALPLPQVRALLQRLPLKYRALCAIGVTTGCRITEILKLRRFDLISGDGRLKEKIAFLILKKKKGPLHRHLSIPATFRPCIIAHLKNEEQKGYDRPDDLVFRGKKGLPLSRVRAYHVFRDFLGEGYGTHWMRKTFAKEIFEFYSRDQKWKDPMRALELTRHALGHARIDTTVRYLGITEESIEKAQKAVFDVQQEGEKDHGTP